MTNKLKKSLEILKKRIRLLDARLDGMTERDADYHDTREERSAYKRILEYFESPPYALPEAEELAENERWIVIAESGLPPKGNYHVSYRKPLDKNEFDVIGLYWTGERWMLGRDEFVCEVAAYQPLPAPYVEEK